MTFQRAPARRRGCVCVCESHPTIVGRCVLVLVGGGQCRYQRFHVHDEVFMAQRIKTSTLAKLGSVKTKMQQRSDPSPCSTLRCVVHCHFNV